jgi:predicted transcriptional regulator
MENDSTPTEVDRQLVARIVLNYVQHHKINPEQLAVLIVDVHGALSSLGRVSPPQEVRTPAVAVKRSVRRNAVVCLECGFESRMLRSHLRLKHGLEPADYRARWKLASDHPITAPSYSAQRSAMAKQLGLGRKRAGTSAITPAPPSVPQPSPLELDPAFAASLSASKRRGRKPRPASAT